MAAQEDLESPPKHDFPGVAAAEGRDPAPEPARDATVGASPRKLAGAHRDKLADAYLDAVMGPKFSREALLSIGAPR